MNSKQLEYFLVLCRTGSISAASEELYLTRQALSKSMQSLEDEAGAKLFVRKSNGVELTEAGMIMRDCAFQSRLIWERAKGRISGHGLENHIRLGCHLTHMPDEIIEYFVDFHSERPGVTVTLHDDENYTRLFQGLRADELDVVYTQRHPEGEDLNWSFVMDFDIYVIANRDNPLVSLEAVDFFRDLKGLLCYVFSKDTIKELTPFADDAGLTLEYMTPSTSALRVALNHDRGIFFAPSFAALTLVGDMIVARKVTYPLSLSGYFVYRRKTTALVREYLDYLRGFADMPINRLDEFQINGFRRVRR